MLYYLALQLAISREHEQLVHITYRRKSMGILVGSYYANNDVYFEVINLYKL